MTKLLKQVYKSYEGARKRAAFENGIAPSEFKQGYRAKLYRYSVVAEESHWRVQRSTVPSPTDPLARCTCPEKCRLHVKYEDIDQS